MFLAFPGHALAQSQETTQNQETSAGTGIQDIVVTAQRREERLQDVPIAVSALTTEGLSQAGVTGTNDLSIAVPGLELGRQNALFRPSSVASAIAAPRRAKSRPFRSTSTASTCPP
ncbi:hypothetical protein [Sphingobium sp.]|uniref:hypothetical protein n=1 Tax=Sphingobium sp. TaxID=1912891 RepID=UPI0028BED202|nr:hypothetical protein [Sphingobium sp.]